MQAELLTAMLVESVGTSCSVRFLADFLSHEII